MSLLQQTEEFLKLPFNQKGFFSPGVFEARQAAGVFGPLAGRECEARPRLVKASKSPTAPTAAETLYRKAQFLHQAQCDQHCAFEPAPAVEVAPRPQLTPLGTTGCQTVIQYRQWADEWRVRTQVDTTSGTAPTAQSGPRLSELLSNRAATKISESCEFMSTKGGYKTFVTGTFNDETRAAIARGDTSIQKEVSRCMDALQKMYQRGWTASSGEKVRGHAEGLAYCWVVEIPKNEQGEDNPHVHMLLGWRVRRRHFDEWSSRIEGIWSNGYFHLEKIKDGLCAGAYMAKAAGYMTKASGDDSQGTVRGNRYGISATARAPDWVTISKSQLHIMGQLIADVYDHLTVKYGEQFRERRALNQRLADTPKTAKATRQKIGQRLQRVREQLRALPVRCNKYQVVLKGYGAANSFFTWAKGEAVALPDWLPEKPAECNWQEGAAYTPAQGHWSRTIRAKFQWLKRARRAWCDTSLAARMHQLQECAERVRAEVFSMWQDYENAHTIGHFAQS